MTLFTWLLTALSILGVILNIRKDRRCFWLWTGTNAAWCVVDAWVGLYAQSALFGVYFCLAVWGCLAWREPELTPPPRTMEE